jgi:hypothetical protein
MTLVLELLPMMINYFDSYTHASCLGIAVQIKIMGESCGLFFSGLWKNTRLCHQRKRV